MSDTTQKPIQLVAELDDEGGISCVWYARAPEAAAKPLTAQKWATMQEATLEFSGAPRAAIEEWIARHLKADA